MENIKMPKYCLFSRLNKNNYCSSLLNAINENYKDWFFENQCKYCEYYDENNISNFLSLFIDVELDFDKGVD